MKLFREDAHVLLASGSDRCVVGLYLKNGVRSEKADHYGLYYLLDSFLLDWFSMILPEDVQIEAKTYYEYSRFLFFDLPDAEQAIQAIMQTPDMGAWDETAEKTRREEGRERAAHFLTGTNAFFDASFFGDPRFLYGVSGDVRMRREDLAALLSQYYMPENRYVCVFTGSIEQAKRASDRIPICAAPTRTVPHTHAGERILRYSFADWDYTEGVLCFPVADAFHDWYALELLCKIMDSRFLSIRGSDFDVGKVMLYFDYGIPRVEIGYSSKDPSIEMIIATLRTLVNKPISDSEVDAAKDEMLADYLALTEDEKELNMFFGWNAFAGFRYAPEDVLGYRALIEPLHSDALNKTVDILDLRRFSAAVIGPQKPTDAFQEDIKTRMFT